MVLWLPSGPTDLGSMIVFRPNRPLFYDGSPQLTDFSSVINFRINMPFVMPSDPAYLSSIIASRPNTLVLWLPLGPEDLGSLLQSCITGHGSVMPYCQTLWFYDCLQGQKALVLWLLLGPAILSFVATFRPSMPWFHDSFQVQLPIVLWVLSDWVGLDSMMSFRPNRP